MRELTFKGFIRQYVKTLSKYDTENLTKLVNEGSTENARYAVCEASVFPACRLHSQFKTKENNHYEVRIF